MYYVYGYVQLDSGVAIYRSEDSKTYQKHCYVDEMFPEHFLNAIDMKLHRFKCKETNYDELPEQFVVIVKDWLPIVKK